MTIFSSKIAIIFAAMLASVSVTLASNYAWQGSLPGRENSSQSIERDLNPERWPHHPTRKLLSPADNDRVENILAAMTIEQKAGQLVIVDIFSIRPSDLEHYPLGAVLAGGNSGPSGSQYATAAEWLALSDDFYASVHKGDFPVIIPLLFGIDAVHGHNNVKGAVVFPHNIGLGAANDPALTFMIGASTARALAVIGRHWTFAPTVAVAQNLSWGRSYESNSGSPQRVRAQGNAYIEGLQAALTEGVDQGDTLLPEEKLVEIHRPGIFGALDANASTIMASYSSWNGEQLHGHRYLLQRILNERLSFDGFVVGDWDAHAYVLGCNPSRYYQAINAGTDMLMVSQQWKLLYQSLLSDAKRGLILGRRLDDAVNRILIAKMRAGVLDDKAPSQRLRAGDVETLQSQKVRSLAGQAVQKSLVLLKKETNTLPIENVSSITVIGVGVDKMSAQCGGWCLTWQGRGLSNDEFLIGDSVLDGIKDHATKRNISMNFDPTGENTVTTDLAIIVLYERAYTEYYGGTNSLTLPAKNKPALASMRRLSKSGVPIVTILLSGRPLWTDDALEQSDSFVAAWLPGTEGGGVADLLFEETLDEGEALNFNGTLSFDWPVDDELTSDQMTPPAFKLGFGKTYAKNSHARRIQ